MNTERTPVTPPRCGSAEYSSRKERRHAFTRLLLSLLLLVLWAFLTRPVFPAGGPGSGSAGQGPGSGQTGQGPGSGQTGQGPGSGQKGQETGGGPAQSRSPENQPEAASAQPETSSPSPPAPQNTPKDETPAARPASDATQDTPADGTATAEGNSGTATTQPVLLRLPADTRTGGASRVADSEGKSGESGYRGFYGVKVSSRGRVLFLVDTSGSMGVPGRSGTRMEILKDELRKALGLDQGRGGGDTARGGGFILIGFSTGVRQFPAQGVCRYTSRAEMREAAQFIESLTPCGGTLMKPAWEKALEAIENYKIKTVYFLTDGEDNAGFGASELLKMLSQRAPGELVVHCFAIGRHQEFMKEVAKARNGRYVCRP